MNPVRNSTEYKLTDKLKSVRISNGMKKYFSHILILFVLIGILGPISSVYAVPCKAYPPNYTPVPNDPPGCTVGLGATPSDSANAPADTGGFWGNVFGISSNFLLDALLFLPGWMIGKIVLPLAGLLLWLSGAILNAAVQYSVVNMSDHLNQADAINNAWKVVRDIANIGFIFVLLYAAIETIVGKGKDNQKLIVNIVTVAVLINFSLFYTKFVIDASNVVAMTFYDAIAPGVLVNDAALGGAVKDVVSVVNPFGTNTPNSPGIANSLMEPLRLQTIMQLSEGSYYFDGTKIVVVGIMGTIVTLIAAFVFFAAALMFIIRFVVLIFVLVLSPIAFVSFVLPKTDEYRKQWLDALLGQSFFAPVYFLLTWIVILVSRGLFSENTAPLSNTFLGFVGPDGVARPGDVTVLLNFLIIITLLITSLVQAKKWASAGGSQVSALTNWATGAAGGLTVGMAGRLSRNTVGRFGATVGDSERLKAAAARGGVGGFVAKQTLGAGRWTSKQNFDVRGAGFAGSLDAGKAQKGGFDQTLKDKRKKEKEYADSLGASDALIAEREREMEKAKATYGGRSDEFIRARNEVDRLKGIDEKEAIKRYRDENRKADGSMIKESDAKDIINANRERYIKEGLKDKRKKQLVESIERSPTYKLATGIEPGTEKISSGISKLADVLAQGSDVITNAIPGNNRIARGTRNVVGAVTFAPAAVTYLTGESVRKIPTLVKAKNAAAIGEIRKGKKPVKDRLEEILREEGELTPEGGGGSTPTTPAPSTGGGGGTI